MEYLWQFTSLLSKRYCQNSWNGQSHNTTNQLIDFQKVISHATLQTNSLIWWWYWQASSKITWPKGSPTFLAIQFISLIFRAVVSNTHTAIFCQEVKRVQLMSHLPLLKFPNKILIESNFVNYTTTLSSFSP